MKTCSVCGTVYNIVKRNNGHICHYCLYNMMKNETDTLINNSKKLQKQHQRMLKIKEILYGD
jgi:hypothetical protein